MRELVVRLAVGLILVSGAACSPSKDSTTSRGSSASPITDTQAKEEESSLTIAPDSGADVVAQVRSSIARIEIIDCEGASYVGSGFALAKWIVTNRHVVEEGINSFDEPAIIVSKRPFER